MAHSREALPRAVEMGAQALERLQGGRQVRQRHARETVEAVQLRLRGWIEPPTLTRQRAERHHAATITAARAGRREAQFVARHSAPTI